MSQMFLFVQCADGRSASLAVLRRDGLGAGEEAVPQTPLVTWVGRLKLELVFNHLNSFGHRLC